MNIHPDVLAAHAQFGGCLELMQKAYEHPDLAARIAALEAENERLRGLVERAQAIISTSIYPNWHASASAALEAKP